MLELRCGKCRALLTEADETWEKAEKTGMCPNCSYFFDPDREREAALLASTPELRKATRSFRAKIAIFGLGISIVCATLLAVQIAAGTFAVFGSAMLAVGLLFGLSQLAYALLYTSRREARSRIARPVDLRALARARTRSP